MTVFPISVHCQANLSLKEHICFGMSPFNSYFSEDRIYQLARWGKSDFKKMHFFVPDIPSAFTLEALGYSQEKATWKARRQSQYLKNKIYRALQALGVTRDRASSMILDWNVLQNNEDYRELLSASQRLFDQNESFQKRCLEATHWVLEKRMSSLNPVSNAMLRSAVRYFLTELPLFTNTPKIVSSTTSIFCYHQTIPFLTDLYLRKLPLEIHEGQGFIIAELSTPEIILGSLGAPSPTL